jgi:hypothetical protein
MNWDAIGAIAELLGAIGVKANSRMPMTDSEREQAFAQFANFVRSNPDWWELHKGMVARDFVDSVRGWRRVQLTPNRSFKRTWQPVTFCAGAQTAPERPRRLTLR